jgi:hypothetical protein
MLFLLQAVPNPILGTGRAVAGFELRLPCLDLGCPGDERGLDESYLLFALLLPALCFLLFPLEGRPLILKSLPVTPPLCFPPVFLGGPLLTRSLKRLPLGFQLGPQGGELL